MAEEVALAIRLGEVAAIVAEACVADDLHVGNGQGADFDDFHLSTRSSSLIGIRSILVEHSAVLRAASRNSVYFLTISAVISPGGALAVLECRDIGQRFLGDRFQGPPCEERLVPRDDHVRESQHPREYIILDHAVGEVFEEQVAFLLINVQALARRACPISGPHRGMRVQERSAAGVDQHRAALSSGPASPH